MMTPIVTHIVITPLIALDNGLVRFDLKYTSSEIVKKCEFILSMNKQAVVSLIQ